MIIWLVKDGEIIPFSENDRAMRMALLGRALVQRGHTVTWWCSDFDHSTKRHLDLRGGQQVTLANGVTLRPMPAGSYQRNISISRARHHQRLAMLLGKTWRQESEPDLVICSLPIIGLLYETFRYSRETGVPFIADVRDLWPDVFWDKAPAALKPVIRLLATRARHQVSKAMQAATGRTAVSPGYLQWALRHAGRTNAGPYDRVFPLGHPGFPVAEREIPEGLAARIEGRFVATFVGTFGYSYDLELVCRAAEQYEAKNIPVSFILVGDGQQMAPLKHRYGNLSNLNFTGWAKAGEVSAILKRSDVGLAPCVSLPNTVPNKPFEYFAAGLPVLSSLSGDMERILEEDGTGLSYAVRDVDGFTAALERLRTDVELRGRMAGQARKVFREKYHESRIYGDFAVMAEDVARAGAERSRG